MARKKERGNGDGDVWPRKNKEGKITSYRAAYVGPDGKRRYISGKNKTEAREALAAARADAAGGVVLDAGKLTVAAMLPRGYIMGQRGPYRYTLTAIRSLQSRHDRRSTGRRRKIGQVHNRRLGDHWFVPSTC